MTGVGRLQGRVAIVTGGGDGIGHGISRRFVAEGAKVLVAEIDEARGRAVVEELTSELAGDAVFFPADVTRKDAVLGMVAAAKDTWGTVDVLVNNAWGGGSLGRVENKTDAEMAHGMNMGFYGPLWAMQASFPIMRAQGRGNIINLCSLNGVNAHMGSLEYNTSKEALRTLTRTAAREWAQYGIIANVICPGAKTASARALEQTMPDLIANAERENPMGRMGDPERDIAPVALFLASDDARYVTGNTIFVDGGSHINGVRWAPELPEVTGART